MYISRRPSFPSLPRFSLLFCLLAITALLCASACRDKNGADGPDAGGDGDGDGDGVSIQDVQNESMPTGTAVTLRGVVVTAIDTYGDVTGSIYVMEPAGGPFSGVQIFLNGTQAASLAVGDLIDVTNAVKDEFALSDDTSGRSLTQLESPATGSISLTKVGTGEVPAPQVLNPWDLVADDAEAEKWEGVLIQFNNVAVLSRPHNVTSKQPLLKEMDVTGPFPVASSLVKFADGIARDDCYASVVGIGDYIFDYKLMPRSAADLTTGGTGCPAQEEDAVACADDKDNDYDGHTDCDDFSCQAKVEACTTATSIVDIQNGTVSTNSAVRLTDVLVTGVDFDKCNLWVADSLVAAQYNGIYGFRDFNCAEELSANVLPGATVNVIGRVSEYNGLTELSDVVVTVTTEAPMPPKPKDLAIPVTGVSVTDLDHATNGEPYEGVLVQTGAVVIDKPDLGFSRFSVKDAAGGSIVITDEIYRHTPTADECFESITGIIHHNELPDDSDTFVRIIAPRSADDVVSVTCPG